jgi:rhamnosyltransferase
MWGLSHVAYAPLSLRRVNLRPSPARGVRLRTEVGTWSNERMQSGSACGVVVTFHPDAEVLPNLTRLRAELDTVIVVDNGSTPSELEELRSWTAKLGCELIENGENLGIATGLNVGLRRGLALGMEWAILFDQDSQVTPGFARTMLVEFEKRGGKLGILVPRYVDKRLGNAMLAVYGTDGAIETAMTSGSLIRMETFVNHGFFVDEMFIDGVDHEHSLRLRTLGYTIEECLDAVLLHSPGTPTAHKVAGRAKPFLVSNYSAIRRYYQERNKVWLLRRYWRRYPEFSRGQINITVKTFIKLVLFEEDKVRKLKYFFLGLWHGFRGRLGRLEP